MARLTPQISAAKLAEYTTSRSARRRRTILHQQAEPPIHIVDRYRIVSHAIAKCIVSRDPSAVDATAKIIKAKAKTPRNERHLQRLNDARDALNCFNTIYHSKVFAKLQLSRLFTKMPRLEVSGVDVIVKPEILIRDVSGDIPRVGCAKIYISKGFPLQEEGQAYLGTMLHWFAEDHLKLLGTPDPKLCYVIDVFDGSFTMAPRTYKRRRTDLASACEEIADRWPQIVKKIEATEPAAEDA